MGRVNNDHIVILCGAVGSALLAARYRARTVVNAMRSLWTVVTALLLAFASEARAQQPAPTPPTTEPRVFYRRAPLVDVYADLTYTSAPEAGRCPDEHSFREQMATRLSGTDVFKPNPRGVYVGKVRVDVSRTPSGFAARYTWEDAEGVTTSQSFKLKGSSFYDCFYLLGDIAVSLSIPFLVLERRYGRKYGRNDEPAKATSCPPVAPCPESPYSVWPNEPPMPVEPKQPKLPERWPVAVRLGGAVWPELIASGWGSIGLSAELGARYRAFSVGAELHADPPLGSVLVGDFGRVSFGRVSGALLLCAHYGWFVGCGVGDVGRFIFPRHVWPLPASVLYGAAGVRAGFEIPLAPPRLFVRVMVDLRAPIHPPSYVFMDNVVFEAAGLSFGGGLGFVAELPL